MSKVVITGGAGFIGSHIAEEVAKEYEVVIIDNLTIEADPDPKLASAHVKLRLREV